MSKAKEGLSSNESAAAPAAPARPGPDEVATFVGMILSMLDEPPGKGKRSPRVEGGQDWRDLLGAELAEGTRAQLAACVAAPSPLAKATLGVNLLRELSGKSGEIPRLWAATSRPCPFSVVRQDELRQIYYRRAVRDKNPNPDKIEEIKIEEVKNDLMGLAFSGGGIRSATFNLGVLQALAEMKWPNDKGQRVLEQFDYLSTVSGGGYIGSWLAGWIKGKQIDEVKQGLAPRHKLDCKEAPPISFLRRYSNYLTPKMGLFSADTWTMIAVYLRNLLLNLSILVAGISAVLILPRLLGWLFDWGFRKAFAATVAEPALAIVCLVLSAVVVARNLYLVTSNAVSQETKQKGYAKQKSIQRWAILPMVLSAYIFCMWFWARETGLSVSLFWAGAGVTFFLLNAILVFLGGFTRCYKDRRPSRNTGFIAVAIGLIICIACAAIGVALLYLFLEFMTWLKTTEMGAWHFVIFGPPLLLVVISTVAVVLLGLMGVEFPDSGREWLSRFKAWLNIYSMAYMFLFAAAIYGPKLVEYAQKSLIAAGGLTAGWLLTTIVSVLAAKNSTTGESAKGAPRSSRLELLARVGPPVFIIGFLLLLSFLINVYSPLSNKPAALDLPSMVKAFSVLVAVTLLLSWRVDINEFSMHHFYKNRLVRCYMGASKVEGRKPNPFTGFDPRDDDALADLRHKDPPKGKPYTGPYPILNGTLNLSAGGQLAWQERKAASFTFTPLYCGYEVWKDDNEVTPGKEPFIEAYGYRPTEKYAYTGGIHIGTAAAISGAAVNPNQGYHTSTAIAFLLTVFNVRLGWWLGNPRREKYSTKSNPTFGLMYMVNELFGLTDERSRYVSISDGGHFENLGIYELVRRGCKYIVACDAEQDESLTFGALGNAIRKCRTDFGVEIDIQPQRIARPDGARHSLTHCVVGTIHYSENDKGTLIYMKASLLGDEPQDVLEYASSHGEFPHQTTGDQWFDESQFESYRKLGYYVARTTFEPALSRVGPDARADALFQELFDIWYPPSPSIESHFTKHTKVYMEIMEKLRTDPDLSFLDAQLFKDAPHLSNNGQPATPTAAQERKGFYLAISMIQLLEDVYLDLNLNDEGQRKHPHNTGWLGVYETWKKSDAVRSAWRVVHKTYSKGFQSFWHSI